MVERRMKKEGWEQEAYGCKLTKIKLYTCQDTMGTIVFFPAYQTLVMSNEIRTTILKL